MDKDAKTRLFGKIKVKLQLYGLSF